MLIKIQKLEIFRDSRPGEKAESSQNEIHAEYITPVY